MSSSVSLSALSALAVIIAAPAFSGGVGDTYVEPAVEPAPVAVAVPQEASNWTGGYVGASINYGNGSVDAQGELSDLLSESGFGSTISEPSGTTGAIRGGYDWENNMVVFGVGAEYSFGEYDGGLDGVLGDVADITDHPLRGLSFGVEQMATIYARAGLLANDNFLVYGLLGWTWADGSISLDGETLTQDVDGYTLGIGGEYLFGQNWSAYGEYSSTNFDEIDNTLGLLEADIDLIKAGLNYRF